MHLCFVCNELPPAPGGGIGAVVDILARSLAAAGHRVTVVGHYERTYDWQLPGVEVRTIPSATRLGASTRNRLRTLIQEIHARTPIDLVEWPSYERLYVAPVPGIVDVIRLHSPLPPKIPKALGLAAYLQRSSYLRTLQLIPNWIGVSQWILDQTKQLVDSSGKLLAAIHNPINHELFHPAPPSEREPVILFAGSVQQKKGAFVLAEAAARFLPTLPNARLVFAGADVTGQARNLVLEKCGPTVAARVEFKGWLAQTDLAALMRRCSLLVSLGTAETFCNVWAEAMASGIPVVASNMGPGPEVVPHEEAGLLVDPLNPAAAAEAIIRLMLSSDLRHRLGNRGREIAIARYGKPMCLQKTLDFYARCLPSA